MGHNQTPMQTAIQTKPREQFVQTPNEEHRSTTVMNQTGTLNRTDTIKWPTIIICFILVITGQSIAKLLENYYYLHTTNKLKRRATWFQSLLQVIGFPFLHTPLYFLLYPDPRKPNQLLLLPTEPLSDSSPYFTLVSAWAWCFTQDYTPKVM
ncbi:hypothetical protein BRARA_G03353 [Brassica rapa]|uniref:Uncharacterized protein n=3 Tax=Brassica TaxID=3705 RepID=A0ABQ8CSV8_BRANA|nr:hypothetical protein HID58_027836 [Brassica napus]RID56130.1 hypothetical protein BRARA_G03353 [Brassica rapa]CDY47520.1 BnaAnng09180D [Brassica napus]VDD02163.1 unnamed protein product [Brassica rapa]